MAFIVPGLELTAPFAARGTIASWLAAVATYRNARVFGAAGGDVQSAGTATAQYPERDGCP
jgi:hypothetical protein